MGGARSYLQSVFRAKFTLDCAQVSAFVSFAALILAVF